MNDDNNNIINNRCNNNNDNTNVTLLLGSNNDSGMVIVSPNNKDMNNDDALDIIQRLNQQLQKRSTRKYFDSLLKRSDAGEGYGLRIIQGGRYELFVNAASKPSKAFDTIADKIINQHGQKLGFELVKTTLLEYAIQQAKCDSRIMISSSSSSSSSSSPNDNTKNCNHTFGTFSILLNYDPVPAQAPHIDLIAPNYQYGLILTDLTDGTILYERHKEDVLQTVDDLVKLWNTKYNNHVPNNIIQALHKEENIQEILRDYGTVLLPENRLVAKSQTKLRAGTLLSLPGSIIHAGPASQQFRAVLFFSSTPRKTNWSDNDNDENKNNNDNQLTNNNNNNNTNNNANTVVEAYNPDTQYSRVYLCGEIVSRLWKQPNIATKERRFLLKALVDEIHSSSVSMAGHFQVEGISQFIMEIEQGDQGKKDKTETMIESHAKIESLCDYEDPTKKKTLLSVDDLMAEYDGALYPVQIYPHTTTTSGDNDNNNYDNHPKNNNKRRRVTLYYPTTKECEGTSNSDNYTLEIRQMSKQTTTKKEENPEEKTASSSAAAAADDDSLLLSLLFDGSNGILKDTNGNIIPCQRKKAQNNNNNDAHDNNKKRKEPT